MESILPWATLVLGLAIGAACCWLVLRSKAAMAALEVQARADLEIGKAIEQIESRNRANQELKDRLRQAIDAERKSQAEVGSLREFAVKCKVVVEQERKRAAEKLALVDNARNQLSDAFKALASQALQANTQSFMQMAHSAFEKQQVQAAGELEKRQQAISALVKPVAESLQKVDEKLQSIETAREGAYSRLTEQVRSMQETQKELRGETANLVKALRSPSVRGRWGELQLRRVVELAGMLAHCDFREQTTLQTENGKLRPDLTVRLPARKHVVVDSKVPLDAYLAAIEAGDETLRNEQLKRHAKNLRQHVKALGDKSYFEATESTPEFVILFIPGEVFFSAALEVDPALIEYGADNNVILATPTTLISLLRAVAYGWREETLAENAKEIAELGRDLYRRIAKMGEHFRTMGNNLRQALEAYNAAIGSLESRVLVTARRFSDLQIAVQADELKPLTTIEQTPRALTADEFSQIAEESPNGAASHAR